LSSNNKSTASLASSTAWVAAGQIISFMCQAAYFILLGRLLGSTEYGVFVGAAAMVAILSQYSALGSHSVLLRYVSPNPALFAEYWGNILLCTFSLGSIFVLFFSFVGPLLAHSYSTQLLACIALGDCLFAQLTLSAGRAFLAFDRARLMALLTLLTNFLRVSFAGFLFWHLHHATAQQWAVGALGVSAIAGIIALILVYRLLGKAVFNPRLLRERIGEGFIFAVSYSTTGIYNDIDKAMLGHYGMNEANGIYTMAYRVVDVCMMPISSLHQAAFPRFFRKGQEGVSSTMAFARKIIVRTAPTGLGLALMMAIAAPLIPHMVGKSFGASTEALLWLSALPFLRSFHMSAGDALTGAGFQKLRLSTQAIAAIFNFSVNLYLIPHYGWHGAAWASLASDGMLGVFNWAVLLGISRRHSLKAA